MGRFDHLVEKYKDKSYEELKDLSTILEDKWENEKKRIDDVEPHLSWDEYSKLVYDSELYWDFRFADIMMRCKTRKEDCVAYRNVDTDSNYPDHIFPISEFKEICKMGGFTSYDGFGEYSDGKKVYRLNASPLGCVYDLENPEFSHVVWYNK